LFCCRRATRTETGVAIRVEGATSELFRISIVKQKGIPGGDAVAVVGMAILFCFGVFGAVAATAPNDSTSARRTRARLGRPFGLTAAMAPARRSAAMKRLRLRDVRVQDLRFLP
jgi:hypothetical protein